MSRYTHTALTAGPVLKAEHDARSSAIASDLADALLMRGGAYDAATAYEENDVVSYGGSLWRALQDTTGNTPAEGVYWTIHGALAALSTDGTLAANSDALIATQKATKAYADTKQPLGATLTALAAYNTSGLLTQTAVDTFTGRTITGTANRITATNGNGVSGNPTLDIGTDVVTLTGAQALTNKTLTTPTIADFTNATHSHTNAAGAGTLAASAIGSGTLATARGGTGISNAAGSLTFDSALSFTGAFTVAAATTISGGGTVALGGFTLTVPATGTAALLAADNAFTGLNTITKVVADPAATTKIFAISSLTNSLTANNANRIYGIEADVRLDQGAFNFTSASGGLRGASLGAFASGASGTVATVWGVAAFAGNLGAGTVTTGVAFLAGVASNSGGGTLTNNTCFDTSAQTAGTNIHGFRGQIVAASNRWNLYCDATAQNFMRGNLGIGASMSVPTAILHLGAGGTAASSAPLKFTSGSLLSVAEAGAMGYNNKFYLTESDTTRRAIVQAASSTVVTAAAPYVNNGYIVLRVDGVDLKFMTTA